MKLNHQNVFFVLFLVFCSIELDAQKEIPIETEIEAVTLYLNAAQVNRVSQSKSIPKGESILVFTNLTQNMDMATMQVKGEGDFTILSVSNRRDFEEKEILLFEDQKDSLTLVQKSLNNQVEQQNAFMKILLEEEKIIASNQNVIAPHRPGSVEELNLTTQFYRKRMMELVTAKQDIKEKLENLSEQVNLNNAKLNELNQRDVKSTYEVLVKVKAEKATSGKFNIDYLVLGASWFPSYDLRVTDVSNPLSLTHKANIQQNTNEDWKDIRLTLSNGDPTKSGRKPELQPYLLESNSYRRNKGNVIGYNQTNYTATGLFQGTITGQVVDQNNLALIGVNIVVEGTTIGTISDIDGKFSIQVPSSSNKLVFSYIGYASQTIPITGGQLNITMNEDLVSLDEVVVVGARKRISNVLSGPIRGISRSRKVKAKNVSIVPTSQKINATVTEFEISEKYTIPSNGKNYAINIEEYEMPTDYNYATVPKLDKDAFLFAAITDWEDLSLLDGEANLYFEGKYLGKTLLQPSIIADTMNVSLGRDQSIGIKRDKIKDFSKKQFLGNKRKVNRTYEITVKNNKNEAIEIKVEDQIPISKNNDVVVEIQELSNGQYNEETGKVEWNIKLAAKETKKLKIQYNVQHPKRYSLTLE